MPVGMDFVSHLTASAERFSFSHWGFTTLGTPLSLDLYRGWLKAGNHASMDYLERHLPMKENPQLLMPKARSAIVVAKNYSPHPYPLENSSFQPRTALYASGIDYHFEFRRELEELAQALKAKYPEEEFLCFTDSAPVMERDLGVQAGLGWIGKNTCLIHPKKGSLFFLGEIFTSLICSDSPTQLPDFCGTCDRCITACPTQAITSPRVLDAGKCISYWTIEAREAAPEPLREKFGDWFFGCDICQTVCPWNEKLYGKEPMATLSQTPVSAHEDLARDLRWILTSSNKALSKSFAKQPYLRARPQGLKRNALYVIGNLRIVSLRDCVEIATADESLREVAEWALQKCSDAISHEQS